MRVSSASKPKVLIWINDYLSIVQNVKLSVNETIADEILTVKVGSTFILSLLFIAYIWIPYYSFIILISRCESLVSMLKYNVDQAELSLCKLGFKKHGMQWAMDEEFFYQKGEELRANLNYRLLHLFIFVIYVFLNLNGLLNWGSDTAISLYFIKG